MDILKKTKIIGFAGILCWILALFLPFLSASGDGFSDSAKILEIDSYVGILIFIVLIIASISGIFFLFKDFLVKAFPDLSGLFNKINQNSSFSCIGLAIYVIIRLIIVRINTVKKLEEVYGSLASYVHFNFSIAFYLIIIGCVLYIVQIFIDKKGSVNNGNQPSQPIYGQPMNNQPTQSTFGQPMNNQPAQPTFGQPMNNQPTQPTFGQPMNNQPAQPTFAQPMNNQPAQPTFGQPMNNQPTQSTFGQPMNNQPVQPTQNQQSYNPYNNNNNF